MNLHNQKIIKSRINYAIAFMILLIIEVIIGLYVHDAFIRPYIGDVLVVILMYAAVRVVIPDKCKMLPLFLFLFAVAVECLQFLNIVSLLGVADNRFLRVIIGTVFDMKDIICYGVGCVILAAYEWKLKKYEKGY